MCLLSILGMADSIPAGDDNTKEPAWRVDQVATALKPEQQGLARELGAPWVGWATHRLPDKFHGLIIFALAGGLVPPALRALEGGGTLAFNGIRMTQIPSLDYDHDVFGERFV